MQLPDPEIDSVFVRDAGQCQHTLDLRGVSLKHARSELSGVLERWHSQDPTNLLIRIDPATADSGETLFLPIGRELLEARKRGLVTGLRLLAVTDGAGFFVELPGPAGRTSTEK